MFKLFSRSPPPPPSFRCPLCGAVSFHPGDIAHRYCGRCHRFVDDPLPPGAATIPPAGTNL